MAFLIALSAQFSFDLPYTDVPVTLQVLMVLLAGGFLGARWGGVALGEYLAAGLAGLPVFAQGKAGPAVLFGPTGGYLIGFFVAAVVVGWITERAASQMLLGVGLLLGVLLIYLFGGMGWMLFHLPLWKSVLPFAVLPFIPVDLLKAGIAWVILSGYRQTRQATSAKGPAG
jgi:biotin transport system substrate-specific component